MFAMKTPKPTALLTALVLTALVLAGCHEPGHTGDDEFPIGALMPLTGDAASLGEPAMLAARLAVQQINANGGVDGRNLRLVEGDTKFPDTGEAIREFERLAAAGVQFIVGALASDSSQAVKPHATEREIVLLSPASTRPSLTGPDHGYFFRVIANDDVQGPQTATIIYDDLGIDSVVVMYQQTGYAQGLRDTFVTAYEGLGGTVTGGHIAWENDPATFEGRAAQAVERNPELIWIAGQAPEIANLIQAIRNQGYDGAILTSEAIEAESIFDAACGAVDGVLFTKAAPDETRSEAQAFRQAYLDRYGSNPGPFDAFAYDAVYVGAAALAAVGNDGAAIRDWLLANGVPDRVTTDTIRFNSNGDVTTGGYALWEIACADGDGAFSQVEDA